ncbi:EAL domain protein [Neorickettsia sennetsu str. Miyayama]|uniref:EAL domain protein n=2 Tax=Ehrlichia sennetsu TaxID=951 RepID=Q2GDW9_EHRS3|nr:EAL domain protein [Neorickettsia sennetsu str. Miyayama]
MLSAGLNIIAFKPPVIVILESNGSSVWSIYEKLTEVASSVFQEYVSFAVGYYVFSFEVPNEVISKAFAAVSFGEKEGSGIVSYASCASRLKEFSNAVAKATVLHNALKNNELLNVFQPIVDTETSSVIFNEFLLRVKGEESIRDCIVAAEKTHLISVVDKFVFKRVVELLERHSDLRLSFNLSMLSASDELQTEEFLKSFATLQFIAKRLVVEITEGVLLHDTDRMFDFIFKLKSLGCAIALDDFGKNFYLPFSELEKLPIDYLKLDREFAGKIKTSKNASIFIKNILEIANNLNIKVVAEFVEDKSVFDLFKELGIRYMQGNYLHGASPELKDTVNA